jgi:TolB-like protein
MNAPSFVGRRFVRSLLSVLFYAVCCAHAPGSPSSVRIAVGPVFAPVNRQDLRDAAQIVPELIAVDLSQRPEFQLVEREKTETIWNELKLDAAGLVSREKVGRLGRMLACDWVISGSFVQAEAKTILWTKIIDARSGTVVDLQPAAFLPGVVTNVARQMAAFVVHARTVPTNRQFVAMGPMVDMTPGTEGHEDWSRRVATLLEKGLMERGYGVAEMAAVGPIFEERRLDHAGVNGLADRIRLQPAFWFIDGGCESLAGPARVAVGLRVQRVGAPPQMLRVTNAPGPVLEQEVLNAVARVLAQASKIESVDPDAEADLLVARGRELAERRSPFQPRFHVPAGGWTTPWDQYKLMLEQRTKQSENRRALMANYESLLLKNPGNLEAKMMLAYGWIGEADPALQHRAMEMFREVAANKTNPGAAAKAQRLLTNKAMLEKMRDSASQAIPRPKDWNSLNMAYQENPNDPEIQCDLGEALIHLPRAHDRQRGREILTTVASGSDATQAARAGRLLAEPEKTPAMVEPAAPPPKPAVAENLPVESDEERGRREFLQQNFEKFVPVQFELVTPGQGLKALAKMQRLAIRQNMLEYRGRYYAGFRFVVPNRVGGGLHWMHLLAKSEAQKDFATHGTFSWYIIPKTGQMRGFRTFNELSVGDYPALSNEFPHTRMAFEQRLDEECLKPGEEYGIWFGFYDKDLPDIAFALTTQSLMGRNVYGQLPLK